MKKLIEQNADATIILGDYTLIIRWHEPSLCAEFIQFIFLSLWYLHEQQQKTWRDVTIGNTLQQYKLIFLCCRNLWVYAADMLLKKSFGSQDIYT